MKIAFADDRLYLSNKILETPSLFIKTVQNHIEENYEAEHPTEISKAIERLMVCNPDKNLKNPYSFKGSFKICMDLFTWALWGGGGQVQIQNTDKLGRTLTTSGNAIFLGGQLVFPLTLSSNFILEGKYWYLPTFSSGAEEVQNLSTSSIFEGYMFYQKRIKASSWSWRLGTNLATIPIARDNNESVEIENININTSSTLLAGIMTGFKWMPGREKGGRHYAYGDLSSFIFSDSLIFQKSLESYSIRLGYKWFFSKRFALSSEGKIQHFYNRLEDEIQTINWVVGIEMFVF